MLFFTTPTVPDIADQPKALRRVGVPLVAALAVLVVITGITVPNFLNAVQRGKQKRTMSDMRTIATAFESYSIDNNRYLATAGRGSAALEHATSFIEPTYVKGIPRLDGWGRPFEVTSTAGAYTVTSFGSDGRPDTPGGPQVGASGNTTDFRNDIIFSTGSFVQFPDGTMM